MKSMIQSDAFNGAGWGSTMLVIGFNLLDWLTNVSFNQILTAVISLLSVVFFVMKIYDQYLITKERKRKKNKL